MSSSPGYAIRHYRLEAGLKQHELGQMVDPPLNQQVVSAIERGGRGLLLTEAKALATALGITLDDLLPEEAGNL